ncbi:prefoldin subunit [Candidatus Woesearchaeota archaeon]|nr:prefoldin subunit [Candidatus Woesearchaeota archaeon]
MTESKETKEKLHRLQLYEQSVQSMLAQKQSLQSQLVEVESASEELVKAPKAYKIVGNLMVLTEKSTLEQELKEKKDQVELRLKMIEKQEMQIKEKSSALQEEIIKEMKA